MAASSRRRRQRGRGRRADRAPAGARTTTAARWRYIGASARGAAHIRNSLPNQDAIGHWPDNGGEAVVLAVSDGHGAARHFRSDVGARLAVAAAIDSLRAFLDPAPRGGAGGNAWVQQLPQRLVARWRQAVAADIAEHPFTGEEQDRLHAEDAEAGVQPEPDAAVAYGATLLAVAIGRAGILYVQIGDGDILAVSADGRTMRPLGQDPRLIGNQTTSLCQPEAWREFRVSMVPPGAAPVLVLLSTDGYANAFASEEGFLQIGRDYRDMIARHGLDRTAAELPQILDEASRQGSGDDVTLGILHREPGAVASGDRARDGTAPPPGQPPGGSEGEPQRLPPPIGAASPRSAFPAGRGRRGALRAAVAAAAITLLLLVGWWHGRAAITLIETLLHHIGGASTPPPIAPPPYYT